jgi:methionyl aminopeptidase
MIKLKSDSEMNEMQVAGSVVGAILYELKDKVVPGISTGELNTYIEGRIRREGMIPTFLGYEGFPASACISINDQVVHGIPDDNDILLDGDIVSIDIGATHNGFVADAARTYAVGQISEMANKLIFATKQSFFEAMSVCKPGYRIGDIGYTISNYVESFGFSAVQDLVGHGVGRDMHEDPQIPNYGKKNTGVKIMNGMALAIEPMINAGKHNVIWPKRAEDWVFVTKDGSLSAHYENTIIIKNNEPTIITLDERDK